MKDRSVPGIIGLLFAVDLALAAAFVFVRFVGPDSYFLSHFVDLNAEGNLPTWFSSGQLAVAGGLLLLTMPKYPKGSRSQWSLAALGLLLLFLSLDEVAQIHEWVGKLSDRYFFGGSRAGTLFSQTGLWMVALVPVVLVWVAWFVRPLLRSAVRSRSVQWLGFSGFAVLLSAAGGVELFSNFLGETRVGATLMAILEESGEMVGGTLLVWAALLVWRGNQPQSPSSESRV